jgi:YidC/Oxa1 family membrane protein insertase
VARDAAAANLALATVSAAVAYEGGTIAPGGSLERRATLYVGPKRLSHLWQQGGRRHEVMDFGTFKWLCMALVPTLNGFHALIPNYGVAIALLTLLVRVIFWPLTHKSTESMKRMQALQPQIKAVQEQFKDNPRKLQQETWRLYRENKVNPLSSCLPMLVQLPVFIALYTVLRSGVELRYAPFLWIRDLSEPENLLAGVLPWPHSVNILPFFMSATMAWQSRLTPSMGDPAQQKMMTWLMPIMMLFMFYSMPSALVLYWTVSQVLAIAQLLWQRHRYAPHPVVPATVSAAGQPLTRQMRRRLGK